MTQDTILDAFRKLVSERRQHYPGGRPNTEDRAGLARVIARKLQTNVETVSKILEASHAR